MKLTETIVPVKEELQYPRNLIAGTLFGKHEIYLKLRTGGAVHLQSAEVYTSDVVNGWGPVVVPDPSKGFIISN